MEATIQQAPSNFRGYPIEVWRANSLSQGNPKSTGGYKHGDKVQLRKAEEASYSGYGGRPVRLIETTEVLEIASFICAVAGRDRWLARLIVDGWDEGMAVEISNLRRIKKS